MSSGPRPVLAVFAAPRWREGDGLEFLRIVAALTAYGRPIRLVETAAGRGVLSSDGLSAEAERFLEALAASDVVPTAIDDEALVEAVASGCTLVRLGAIDRTGVPALLETGCESVTASTFAAAGQVITADPAQE